MVVVLFFQDLGIGYADGNTYWGQVQATMGNWYAKHLLTIMMVVEMITQHSYMVQVFVRLQKNNYRSTNTV